MLTGTRWHRGAREHGGAHESIEAPPHPQNSNVIKSFYYFLYYLCQIISYLHDVPFHAMLVANSWALRRARARWRARARAVLRWPPPHYICNYRYTYFIWLPFHLKAFAF